MIEKINLSSKEYMKQAILFFRIKKLIKFRKRVNWIYYVSKEGEDLSVNKRIQNKLHKNLEKFN